jgi:hypothetical protein
MSIWKAEIRQYIEEHWKQGELFTLGDLSAFEEVLKKRFPNNDNVHHKFCKIMFHLRKEHFIEPTVKRGRYRKA